MHRAWRTGGKVITMIVIAWVIPTLIFFIRDAIQCRREIHITDVI